MEAQSVELIFLPSQGKFLLIVSFFLLCLADIAKPPATPATRTKHVVSQNDAARLEANQKCVLQA